MHFSKGLYFTGQSSSKLQQLQTLALWEATTQPSGLRSGQLGYGSPELLRREPTAVPAVVPHRRGRSLRPGDMGALHGPLHGRCWRGG